jgi:hypothetical protein
VSGDNDHFIITPNRLLTIDAINAENTDEHFANSINAAQWELLGPAAYFQMFIRHPNVIEKFVGHFNCTYVS